MPSTTPVKGAPYPLPTEPVRDGAVAIKNLAVWVADGAFVKMGRIDRAVEANGYLRLTSAESFPGGVKPSAIVALGINAAFDPKWDGSSDGAGCLLKVFGKGGVFNAAYGSGETVAIYFIAFK